MPVFEFDINGLQAVEEILKQFPSRFAKKPMVAAFRKGAAKFTKVLKQNTPKKTGDTRKSVKVLAQRGIGIAAGFSGKGDKMPNYMKAYWLNYGTLSNRDSAHSFVKGRRSQSRNWSGGIRAKKFVETSWEQTKKEVESTIVAELDTQTKKFLQKYAVK